MNARNFVSIALAFSLVSSITQASYHVMQIEEFIAGVNGNTSAQAIQLRMRSGGQNLVTSGRVRAWDANGANPVMLIDMTTNVANGLAGDNVLLTSSAFNTIMASVGGYSTDFTLTNTIPLSYLSGGKITFESNAGLVYWSLAFGTYLGTNTGSTQNDADGDFGAPAVAPPTGSREGIRFTGAATALSTTNAADYALTPNPATVRNNARLSFTVVPEPGTASLLGLGAFALAARRRRG